MLKLIRCYIYNKYNLDCYEIIGSIYETITFYLVILLYYVFGTLSLILLFGTSPLWFIPYSIYYSFRYRKKIAHKVRFYDKVKRKEENDNEK